MMRDDEPMTTFDDAEWRAYKRATRRLQQRRRLERTTEADPVPWLAAVRRDDATDPALATGNRHQLEEQAA